MFLTTRHFCRGIFLTSWSLGNGQGKVPDCLIEIHILILGRKIYNISACASYIFGDMVAYHVIFITSLITIEGQEGI